jgi:hypothetical protein
MKQQGQPEFYVPRFNRADAAKMMDMRDPGEAFLRFGRVAFNHHFVVRRAITHMRPVTSSSPWIETGLSWPKAQFGMRMQYDSKCNTSEFASAP